MVESQPATARRCWACWTDSRRSAIAGTKVIVIGHVNDVALYRELIAPRRQRISRSPGRAARPHPRRSRELYRAPGAEPVGRTIAVVGAKGGVGASTVAHNVAWAIARELGADTVVADLDLPSAPPARLQPGSAAGHRRGGVLARPARRGARRPAAGECADHLSCSPRPRRSTASTTSTRDALRRSHRRCCAPPALIVLDVPHLGPAGRGGRWSAPTRS